MSKLRTIYNGWKNAWKISRHKVPQPIQDWFDSRRKICETNECGYHFKGICTACGCPLRAKTKALEETCPENLWLPYIYTDEKGESFVLKEQVPPEVLALMLDNEGNQVLTEDRIPLYQWNIFLSALQNLIDEDKKS